MIEITSANGGTMDDYYAAVREANAEPWLGKRIITPEDCSDLTTELMEEQSSTIAQLEAERDALRQELSSLRRRIGWQADDSEAIGAKALLDSRTTRDGLTAAVEMARHAVYTLNARYLRSMLGTGEGH